MPVADPAPPLPVSGNTSARDRRMFGALLGALRAYQGTSPAHDDERMPDDREIAAINAFLALAGEAPRCPVTRAYMGITLPGTASIVEAAVVRALDRAFLSELSLP